MIKKILFSWLLLFGAASLADAQRQTLTIDQLFTAIEDNNVSLRTQKTGVEAADLGIESAKSKRLPDVDASLSVSYIGNVLLTDRDFTNVHGLSSTP